MVVLHLHSADITIVECFKRCW